MPKTFARELYYVVFQKQSGSEKDYGEEGGWASHDFPSKTFCLTVPNSFAGEPFSAVFQQTSGSEKYYGIEGGIKIIR